MDIHKPKAAHSWREFLIEIGTIICGILIALGLEQVVEAVHRGVEVREARESIHEEMTSNAERLTYALEEDKCALSQLDTIDAWSRGGPKPKSFRMFSPITATSAWETAKGTALSHFPLRERLQLTNLFDLLANNSKVREFQIVRWHDVISASAHERLEPAEARRLGEATAVMRLLTRVHATNIREILGDIAEIGVAAPPLGDFWRTKLDWVCGRSISDPFDVKG